MDSPVGRTLFQKRNEKIDWRKLASVDVDRIALEVDVDAIQDNILSLTYCNIEHELGYHSLDSNFVKLFRLSQLTIEYLLHCQDYLQQCLQEKENQVNSHLQQVNIANTKQNELTEELSKRNESCKNLKKELQKCRKLISDYQLMVRAGANGLHRCPCCSKSFVSEYYLRSHVERRHPEEAAKRNYPVAVNQTYQNDTNLLNELNDIKTRLQSTENELKSERQQMIKMKMQDNETREALIEEFRNEHEQWKFTEQQKMKLEMDTHKEMIMNELKQTQNEKEVLQKNLMELQQSIGKKRSTLGMLLDEDETEESYFAKQKQEFKIVLTEMKDQYGQQVRDILKQHKAELKQEDGVRQSIEAKMQEKDKFYIEEINQLKQMIAKQQKKEKDSRDFVDYGKPPTTPVQSLQPEPRIKEPIVNEQIKQSGPSEKDTMSLWVSIRSNGHQAFRLSKQPASTKGEWKQLFTFNALIQPSGDFDKPLYVYSCGGSPYWRQYVSPVNRPPKACYKHDFTFFVSENKYIGTIRLRILQTGSGEVTRSCITKDEIIPNWKDTGFVFYALKNTEIGRRSLNSMSRSVTSSSLFGSVSDEEDDVSLSSFVATDLVKQNLVEEIKRSRENLMDDESNIKEVNKDQEDDVKINDEMNDEEEGVDSQIRKSNDMNDEGQSNFDGTSSGSLLGTTLLPEKGEFYPYPENRLARSSYNHPKERLDEERNNIIEFLEDNMEKHGVDNNDTLMSTSIYNAKMKNHEKEVQMVEKKYTGFSKLRQSLRNALDNYAMKCFKRQNNDGKNKFKKTAVGIQAAIRLTNNESEENLTEDRRRELPVFDARSASDKSNKTFGDVHHKSNSKSMYNEDEVSEDEDFDEDSYDEVDRNIKMAQPVNNTAVFNQNMKDNVSKSRVSLFNEGIPAGSSQPKQEDEPEDDEDFDVSRESSQWDSGGDNMHDVNGYQSPPEYNQEEYYNPKLRPPQGENVKKLAASLEASLSLRDPNKKKPAGSIDLYDTDGFREDAAKRKVSFRNDNDVIEDLEDESDFSITPRETRNNSKPNVRKDADDFADDDDIDQVLGSYRPQQSFSKPSSSSTPYRNNRNVHDTPVQVLNVDDFDDDDSF